jgi:hypothetical protein
MNQNKFLVSAMEIQKFREILNATSTIIKKHKRRIFLVLVMGPSNVEFTFKMQNFLPGRVIVPILVLTPTMLNSALFFPLSPIKNISATFPSSYCVENNVKLIAKINSIFFHNIFF